MKKKTPTKRKIPNINEWNYRLISHGDSLLIHEVYYENGKPVAWTEEPVWVVGEDQNEILKELKSMAECCLLPVLEVKKNKLYEITN